jgi:hypothetical protein
MGELLKACTFLFEALNSFNERTALVLKRTIIPVLKGFSHEGSFETQIKRLDV